LKAVFAARNRISAVTAARNTNPIEPSPKTAADTCAMIGSWE
jgi:hypothetical protein